MLEPLPPLSRWNPAGSPVGCVHIVHGMAEHRGRYAAFASRLASAGYVVWAHDHRGHGTNVRLGKGHFADGDGWRALVHDTITVTRRLAVEYPSTPVFLFGHSMGSFSGQTLMSERAVDYAGVVLAGSNGPATASHCLAMVLAMFERRFRGRREQSRWLNALLRRTYNRQFQPARAPADWLTRDEREVDAALADALCGIRLTTQSWVDFARGLLALDAPRRFTRVPKSLPILILSGARDPVGQNRRGAARLARGLERSGALDVTLRLYPLAPHELVNETNRDEVTRDVIDCLNARSSHRGVGIDGSSKTREAGCTDISGAFRLDGHAVSPAGVPRAVLSEQVLRGRVT